jgi:AcrR family transcriptional regulator
VTTASTAPHQAGVPGTAPDDFRRRLLEGMAAAIRECGFRDATVADVVRHARTSRRTFYEHFGGKQACFIALLREANAAMVRQIAAAVDRRAPWDVQVRQAIETWIASAQADLDLTPTPAICSVSRSRPSSCWSGTSPTPRNCARPASPRRPASS